MHNAGFPLVGETGGDPSPLPEKLRGDPSPLPEKLACPPMFPPKMPILSFSCSFWPFCPWAGAPICYLELLDKLQKQISRTVGRSLAASLEPLAHR